MVKAFWNLEKVKQEAGALGIFTDERELLECPSCGLPKDVTEESSLVTYPKDSEGMKNIGLCFSQIDENSFICPACGVTVRTEIKREKAMIVREREERYG